MSNYYTEYSEIPGDLPVLLYEKCGHVSTHEGNPLTFSRPNSI